MASRALTGAGLALVLLSGSACAPPAPGSRSPAAPPLAAPVQAPDAADEVDYSRAWEWACTGTARLAPSASAPWWAPAPVRLDLRRLKRHTLEVRGRADPAGGRETFAFIAEVHSANELSGSTTFQGRRVDYRLRMTPQGLAGTVEEYAAPGPLRPQGPQEPLALQMRWSISRCQR